MGKDPAAAIIAHNAFEEWKLQLLYVNDRTSDPVRWKRISCVQGAETVRRYGCGGS